MSDHRWEEFIRKSKKEYREIGYISCPAFGDELIRFDERGFNHLVMKNGVQRSRPAQRRKFKLMRYVESVLQECTSFSNYYKSTRSRTSAYFWSLKAVRGDRLIIVIIRKINDGNLHFLSIMDKKLPKSTQTP